MSTRRGAGDENRSKGRDPTHDWKRIGSAWVLVFLTTVTTKGGSCLDSRDTLSPLTHTQRWKQRVLCGVGGSYPVEDWCCWSIAFFLDDEGIGCFWLRYIPLASLLVRYPGQFAARALFVGSWVLEEFLLFLLSRFLVTEIIIIQGSFLMVQYCLGFLVLCL